MDAPGDFPVLGERSRRILSRMDRPAGLLHAESPPSLVGCGVFYYDLRPQSKWIRRAVHATQVPAESANCKSCGMAASVALGTTLRFRYSPIPRRDRVAVFLAKSEASALDIVRRVCRSLTHRLPKHLASRLFSTGPHRGLFSVSIPAVTYTRLGNASHTCSGNHRGHRSWVVLSISRRCVDNSRRRSQFSNRKSPHRTSVQHLRTRRFAHLATMAAKPRVYRRAWSE